MDYSRDNKVWWFCANCNQVIDRYCGTSRKIGDKPWKMQGKPCVLVRPLVDQAMQAYYTGNGRKCRASC